MNPTAALLVIVYGFAWAYLAYVFHVQCDRKHPLVALLWPITLPFLSIRALF